jgi:hypothetical protein
VKREILIVGAMKCGTTSLFQYLRQHPGVIAAPLKELHFFDTEGWFADPAAARAAYAARFADAVDRTWLEATPSYLYRPDLIPRLTQVLTDPLLVIAVREPVGRLVSLFRHHRRNARFPESLNFTEFLREQSLAGPIDAAEDWRGAWRSGDYGSFIEPYLGAFGGERIAIVFTEDLARDPRSVVDTLVRRAGLAADPVAGMVFGVHNEGHEVRWPQVHRAYRTTTRWLRERAPARGPLRAVLRAARRSLDKAYMLVGSSRRGVDALVLDADAIARAREMYAPTIARMAQIAGRLPPEWTAGGEP